MRLRKNIFWRRLRRECSQRIITVLQKANPLYSMVRLEDIEALDRQVEVRRRQIIAADGAANYMRPFLNALTEEEFDAFLQYHLATCERMDLMGASGHTVDILVKEESENV